MQVTSLLDPALHLDLQQCPYSPGSTATNIIVILICAATDGYATSGFEHNSPVQNRKASCGCCPILFHCVDSTSPACFMLLLYWLLRAVASMVYAGFCKMVPFHNMAKTKQLILPWTVFMKNGCFLGSHYGSVDCPVEWLRVL